MQEYDSDLLQLRLVPFIVELEDTLSYKVHIGMTSLREKEHSPYFELIEVRSNQNNNTESLEYIGYKCLEFFATCSVFILKGSDGYHIFYEPAGWFYERDLSSGSDVLSLDDDPATGAEAWEIYFAYLKHTDSLKVEQMIDDLDANRVKPEYIMKLLPDFIRNYETSNRIDSGLINRFKAAVAENVLRDKVISKKKRVVISNKNLLEDYYYLLNKQSLKNKTLARKEAIDYSHPNINEHEFQKIDKDFREQIRVYSKDEVKNAYIQFLYPELNHQDTAMTDPINKIKHHFIKDLGPAETDEEDEFEMIMQMIKDNRLG